MQVTSLSFCIMKRMQPWLAIHPLNWNRWVMVPRLCWNATRTWPRLHRHHPAKAGESCFTRSPIENSDIMLPESLKHASLCLAQLILFSPMHYPKVFYRRTSQLLQMEVWLAREVATSRDWERKKKSNLLEENFLPVGMNSNHVRFSLFFSSCGLTDSSKAMKMISLFLATIWIRIKWLEQCVTSTHGTRRQLFPLTREVNVQHEK